MAIPDLVAGLQQGKLIAVVTATASADRELLMEFSHPYYSPSFDNAECRLTKQDIESCLV
jgi:hypothetical protein